LSLDKYMQIRTNPKAKNYLFYKVTQNTLWNWTKLTSSIQFISVHWPWQCCETVCHATVVIITSFNNLVHHVSVAVSFFQLRSSNPDLSISRNVFTSLVQHLTCVVIALQSRQRQPQLQHTTTTPCNYYNLRQLHQTLQVSRYIKNIGIYCRYRHMGIVLVSFSIHIDIVSVTNKISVIF